MVKITKCFMIVLTCFLVFNVNPHVQYASEIKAILTVKASPNSKFKTEITISNHKLLKTILKKGVYKNSQIVPVTDTYLTLIDDGLNQTYLVDPNFDLFNERKNQLIELPGNAKNELISYVADIQSVHYGDMIPWKKVNRLIPRKRKFQVIDLETGLKFNVQRRAGKNHADVQPLTRSDTAIMKQIYNGKWSWQRKAILIKTGKHLFAASMHGMPHGGDGISNNGFSGHFCIHFMDSATHGTGKVDPGHQLMVRKAAGKIDEFVNHASPYDIINTFFVALNLGESQIIKLSFPHANHNQLPYFINKSQDQRMIIHPRSTYKIQESTDLISLDIPIKVSIFRKGQKEEKAVFTFQMKRTSLMGEWKIDYISMVS